MKRLLIFVMALFITATSFAQKTPKEIYKKYSDAPGITAVYISPSMFRMIGKLPKIEIKDNKVDISSIIKKMDGFYLLSMENTNSLFRSILQQFKENMDQYMQSRTYELLLEAKEGSEQVRIYEASKGDIVTDFILLTNEANAFTFMSFSGQIPREELEKAVATAIKDD